jgi:hypothetical protein
MAPRFLSQDSKYPCQVSVVSLLDISVCCCNFLGSQTLHSKSTKTEVSGCDIWTVVRVFRDLQVIVLWLGFTVLWLKFTVLWLRFFLTWLRFFLPWLRFFLAFSSVVRQNARVKLAKTGHRLHSMLFGCYLCSMYCLCVNVYCHQVTTQLQLINISIEP